MDWFSNKGQVVEVGLQLVSFVWGPSLLAAATAIIQQIRAVPLDWWVLGTVFIGSLILFVYADRRRWGNAEERVRSPLLEVNANTEQWPLPSAGVVVDVVERLKRPFEVSVKILVGVEGQAVTDLLVRILRLFDWRLQDNPESASYVFPFPPGNSLQGIRVRYRRQSLPVVSLEFLHLCGVLERLFSYPVKEEYFPDTDAYNFIQIEIGSRPSLSR